MSDGQIHFFYDDFPELQLPAEAISNWLKGVIQTENTSLDSLNIIVCTDEDLLKINRDYLKHNYYTDIVTFDLSTHSKIEGELYLSLDRIKENANEYKVNWRDEFCRVCVHGLLHLIGFNDKSHEEQELMKGKEDYYLSLRSFSWK